jgi:predicted CXXCH cytochrome family protein
MAAAAGALTSRACVAHATKPRLCRDSERFITSCEPHHTTHLFALGSTGNVLCASCHKWWKAIFPTGKHTWIP